MKVVCIKKGTSEYNEPIPDVGDICTVLLILSGYIPSRYNGWYVFEEFPNDNAYNPELFSPISDQENLQLTEQEAEEIRERQKQLI